MRVEVVDVEFAGLKCLAVSLPDDSIVVQVAGDGVGYGVSRYLRPDAKPSEIVPKGVLACSVCPNIGRAVPNRVYFIPLRSLITFPFVISPSGPDHYFVVDDVVLATEFETRVLRYRVTCPRCRADRERMASNVFIEHERQARARA
jgi:hypothetical protein